MSPNHTVAPSSASVVPTLTPAFVMEELYRAHHGNSIDREVIDRYKAVNGADFSAAWLVRQAIEAGVDHNQLLAHIITYRGPDLPKETAVEAAIRSLRATFSSVLRGHVDLECDEDYEGLHNFTFAISEAVNHRYVDALRACVDGAIFVNAATTDDNCKREAVEDAARELAAYYAYEGMPDTFVEGIGAFVNAAIEERSESTVAQETTEERGLCAVCLTPANKCDGKTCRLEPSTVANASQLRNLARAIAVQVYKANGGAISDPSIAKTPALEAWASFAFAVGMLESKRPFNEPEASLITYTYRNEIAELAGQRMDAAAIEDPTEWPPEAGKAERVLTRAMLDGVPAAEAWARATKVCPAYEMSGASGRDDRAPTSESAENLSRATVARPTDRQLAFVVELLDTRPPLLSASHALYDEAEASLDIVNTWLSSLVPPGSHEKLLSEIDSCNACHAPLKMIGGNMVCPECEGGEDATPGPVVAVTTTTVETSPTVAEVYDSGNASKASAISAKAAARDAMARGADPLIVVDLALREIARFREKTGLSPQYVAQDPLAALVIELRHKRVPPAFARVVRALALAGREQAQMKDGYDDGHERRCGDWSLDHLLELADLAAMEGSREEVAEKAIAVAEFLASMLPGWQETICHEREGSDDLADPKIRVEIISAADEFIAGLTKAAL